MCGHAEFVVVFFFGGGGVSCKMTFNSHGQHEQSFDLDDYFTDIHFFFKLSSARREDYAALESIMNVVAEYAEKHTETRWLSMKYVALRCLEQWSNLREYFLNCLPKQKSFRSEISRTQRYVRIKDLTM